MGRKKAAVGPLGTERGYPVTLLSIAFRNAGDGLSKSLAIDPISTEPGTVNTWLVRTVTGPIDHNPLNAKGKRVKADDLAETGFDSWERVEDQMVLRVARFAGEDADAVFDALEDRIATMTADRERAERAARGEVDLDQAVAEKEAAEAAAEFNG